MANNRPAIGVTDEAIELAWQVRDTLGISLSTLATTAVMVYGQFLLDTVPSTAQLGKKFARKLREGVGS